MDKNWSIFEKNRLLDLLKEYVKSDSCWLTNDDQNIIEMKIDELSKFIDDRYQQHGRIVTQW